MKIYPIALGVLMSLALCRVSANDTNAPSSATASVPATYEKQLLKAILADADANKDNPELRKKYLNEFLTRSATMSDLSSQTNIWILRAAAAVELDDVSDGWQAGQQLKRFGMQNGDNSMATKVMIELDRKGWLADQSPDPAEVTKREAVKQVEMQEAAKIKEQATKQKLLSDVCGKWRLTGNATDLSWTGQITITNTSSGSLIVSGDFYWIVKASDGYKHELKGTFHSEGFPEIDLNDKGNFTLKIKDIQGPFTDTLLPRLSHLDLAPAKTSCSQLELDYGNGALYFPTLNEAIGSNDSFVLFAYTHSGLISKGHYGLIDQWVYWSLKKIE